MTVCKSGSEVRCLFSFNIAYLIILSKYFYYIQLNSWRQWLFNSNFCNVPLNIICFKAYARDARLAAQCIKLPIICGQRRRRTKMYTNGSLGENKNLSRDKDAEKRALAHRQADRGRRLQKMERGIYFFPLL